MCIPNIDYFVALSSVHVHVACLHAYIVNECLEIEDTCSWASLSEPNLDIASRQYTCIYI